MEGFVKLLNSSSNHESPIIRFSHDLHSPISQVFGLDTPAALFARTVETYGEKRCLAFRKVIAHVLETRLLGDWQYYTYAEVGRRVKEMGAGLKKLLNGKKVQRLHMSAANSANWFMLSHAASMASIELICINTRLGQRELTHTLTDIPATAVFTEGLFISRLLTPLVECPHVRLLIYDTSSEVDTDLEAINCEIDSLKVGLEGRVKIISIEELCKTGIEVMEIPELEKPKDKGRIWGHIYARALNEYVMPSADPVTNSQVAAGFAGLYYALKSGLVKGDTYLSYLPLYIRLEYNIVNVFFMSGVTLGFGTNVDSFLLSAPYNPKVCPASYGDIQSFSPSILFGITPWWDTIHEKLLASVATRSAIEQSEFWKWLDKKRDVVAGYIPRLVPVSQVFEKWGHIAEIRSSFFGDRIRWIGVTCSMMTAEKREFLGLVLGGPKGIMVEGWGLPHMSSDITFMPPQHHTRTGLGRPLPSVEIKLVTAADEGVGRWRSLYRGRIFIRGPSLTNPGAVRKRTGINIDLTLPSSSSNEDEWIETHRIGEWNASRKSFRVIGNLLEPLTARYLGDYIPIERLELVYKKRPYVTECILFHSWKSTRLISIICIAENELRKFAAHYDGLQTTNLSLGELIEHEPLRTEVIKDLRKYGIKAGLVEFELLSGLIMVSENWDKKLRQWDGTVDREKLVAKYSLNIQSQAQVLSSAIK